MLGDPLIRKNLHIVLGLADKDQHARGTFGAMQPLLQKRLARQPGSTGLL